MLYFFIAGFILSSLTGAAALLLAGYLYGQNKTQGVLMVEGKRRERRQIRDLSLLHDKLSQKAGMGTLHRKVYSETPQPKGRRFVAPSESIIDLKKQIATGIPPGIKQQFLEDAGKP